MKKISTEELFQNAQTAWKDPQPKETLFTLISDFISDSIDSIRINRYAKRIAKSISCMGNDILTAQDIAKLQYGISANSLYDFSGYFPPINLAKGLTKEEVNTPLKIGEFNFGKFNYAQTLAEVAIKTGLEVTYLPFAQEPGNNCDKFMAVGLTFKVKEE